MKPAPEILCLVAVAALIGSAITDFANTETKFVGQAQVVETSDSAILVEHGEQYIQLASTKYSRVYRPGDVCKLYEIVGLFGRYGWCVTKEVEPR